MLIMFLILYYCIQLILLILYIIHISSAPFRLFFNQGHYRSSRRSPPSDRYQYRSGLGYNHTITKPCAIILRFGVLFYIYFFSPVLFSSGCLLCWIINDFLRFLFAGCASVPFDLFGKKSFKIILQFISMLSAFL